MSETVTTASSASQANYGTYLNSQLYSVCVCPALQSDPAIFARKPMNKRRTSGVPRTTDCGVDDADHETSATWKTLRYVPEVGLTDRRHHADGCAASPASANFLDLGSGTAFSLPGWVGKLIAGGCSPSRRAPDLRFSSEATRKSLTRGLCELTHLTARMCHTPQCKNGKGAGQSTTLHSRDELAISSVSPANSLGGSSYCGVILPSSGDIAKYGHVTNRRRRRKYELMHNRFKQVSVTT